MVMLAWRRLLVVVWLLVLPRPLLPVRPLVPVQLRMLG